MTTYCPQQDQHYNPVSLKSIADSAPAFTTDVRIVPNVRSSTIRSSLFSSFLFSSLRARFQKIQSWYVIRREQKINRDAFLYLLTLDDQLLSDIGVTRASVKWAASLPLSEDAAMALEETTTRRR